MDSAAKARVFKRVVIGFAVLFAILILWPIVQVGAQERGVVLRNGAVNRTIQPGLHLKLPILERVMSMNVATQKEEVDASAASADLQDVTTKVALNFNLDAGHVADVYEDLQNDYTSRVVAPAIQEAVKSATAKYTAEQLITKREEVKGVILSDLKNRLSPRFINVQDILITDFSFSSSFNAAIEAKVKAEQDALASKNKLAQVKYEAEQTVTKAKADAEAIQIQAQAITQQGGRDYVQLQAINKWDGHLPQQFVPGSAMPFLNLNN